MKIVFLRENKSIEYDNPVTIADAAAELGIKLSDGMCGMKKCGRCKVAVTKGNDKKYSDAEYELLTDDERRGNYRLACAYKPDVDVTVMTLASTISCCDKRSRYEKDINIKCRNYCVIDIGTTTLELYIYDEYGDVIIKRQMDNPLRIIGNDVISRIAYASTHERLCNMQNMIKNSLEKLIGADNIKYMEKIIVTGNTTMMHIFTGHDIRGLGRAPFSTGYMGGEMYEGMWDVPVLVPPFIGGHVGADALCCLYGVTDNLPDEESLESVLIIDVGTNSEMILKHREKIYCCSAAAGPAFEESNISSGLKKAPGAVVRAKQEKEELVYTVIGDDETGELVNEDDEKCKFIKGICASAVIDLISCLLDKRLLDKWGTLSEELHGSFVLSNYCKNVSLTQKDIRNIQMAKGAIRAGLNVLLAKAGVAEVDISKIYLAGNFGNNIDIENAVKIGLLPDVGRHKYVFSGNAAARGAYRLAVKDGLFDSALCAAKKIEHVELALSADFKDEYIKCMNFVL